jgi:dihydropteroate synthase
MDWPNSRATVWRLCSRAIEFGRLPLVMGIVNVTPDSFSDGGRFLEPAAAVDHALRLIDDGADLIDIGGQSTRPGAAAVEAEEELRRVMLVVERLCGKTSVPVSIDTFCARVAREAVAAGVEVINDVTAMTGDPEMVGVAVESRVGVCVMHMRGTPRTMQDKPEYADVVGEVREYLARRRDALMAAGIERERICLDPGLGFGKTTEHNLELLARIRESHALGCPLLVGPSRKAFIGCVLGDMGADRLPGTIGVVLAMATAGVQVVRVHDVAEVRRALALFEASGGMDAAVSTV